MAVYDGSPRQGMEGSPGTPSGNDAYDRTRRALGWRQHRILTVYT